MPALSSQDWLVPKVCVGGIVAYIFAGYIAFWICQAVGVNKSRRHYASLVQFVSLSALNYYLFHDEEWWFRDLSKCFTEDSMMTEKLMLNTGLHLVYGLHLANDFMQLGKNMQALTIVQTSARLLLVHDFVTINLVVVSWLYDYPVVGVVIMFIHDFTDVSFHTALVVFETGSEHVATWLVYLFAVSQWVYFRIYTLGSSVFVIYSVWFLYSNDVEAGLKAFPNAIKKNPDYVQLITGIQVKFLIGFLATLVVMHTIWLVQIIQKILFSEGEKKQTSRKKNKKA